MNANILAKIFGWAQFGITTLGTVLSSGLPHGIFGWVTLLGSLATAVGVHSAAESTPTPAK